MENLHNYIDCGPAAPSVNRVKEMREMTKAKKRRHRNDPMDVVFTALVDNLAGALDRFLFLKLLN